MKMNELSEYKPITEKHLSIAEIMIEKTKEMLKLTPQILSYGVQQNAFAAYETLELEVNSKTRIKIEIRNEK